MLKDIRKTPERQSLRKAVGAKYLIKTFGRKTKGDAAPASEAFSPAFSPLQDALVRPPRTQPIPIKPGRAAAAVAAPRKGVANKPLRDYNSLRAPAPAPQGRGSAPPPMPEGLKARATAAPAPRIALANAIPGFSPLADAAHASPRAKSPRAAPAAKVARKASMRLRQLAQHDSPEVPTVFGRPPADFNVPVLAAYHTQNIVRNSNNEVRLLHGRQAAAQGSFGRFYRAITPEGELRGIKQVNISGLPEAGPNGLRPSGRRELVREVNHMKRLGMTVYALHETPEKTMLIESELFAGDLTRAFRNIPRSMRSVAARSALAQQAQQLDGLHLAGFMHRDVKSENTFFTEQGVVQVADPGLALPLDDGLPHGCTGTRAFMAPEVLYTHKTGPAVYDAKIDTWSLGAVACESLVRAPWPPTLAQDMDETFESQKQLILFRRAVMRHGEVDLKAVTERKDDKAWGTYFHQMALADKGMCKFVLGRMLDPNSKTRATMQEVIAATQDVSTVSKVMSTLTLNTAGAAFKIAALADKRYQAEVGKLRAQCQRPVGRRPWETRDA